MGLAKKESMRRARQGKTDNGLGNVRVKGENFYRNALKLKTLNMYKEGEPQRNTQGKITLAAAYQSRDIPNARIEPNRRWFTNTRSISQNTLESFREAWAKRIDNPYQVLIKSNKLPLSLINDIKTTSTGPPMHTLISTLKSSAFSDVFGPKAKRKRVTMSVESLDDLASRTFDTSGQNQSTSHDSPGYPKKEEPLPRSAEPIFDKGQSKRIWNELYKVIDSSDIILHVLDARDPIGTRCKGIERFLKQEAPHKHLVFILNKCDLVPTGIAAGWVRRLSKEQPTLAFHASITNSFGKGLLITLLRQLCSLHENRKQISVGLIGGPNTGKSSIINTLLKKKVCTVAPVPGETKVWQYVSLTKRIYLIDCPGVVPPSCSDSPTDLILRGVIRVEKVQSPEQYIPAVLSRVRRQHLEQTYGLRGWENATELLESLARKSGRLLRGGEPDLSSVAKVILNDFMRGKIPWFVPLEKNNVLLK